MEDCNALVSDCIILSCCCQCLILRFVVFVFFQVPRKVARKLKEYAERKLISNKRRNKKKKKQSDDDGDYDYDDRDEIVNKIQRVDDRDDEEDDDDEFDMCLRILELEGIRVKEVHNWGSCAEEVDKVLGELALKGEFGFGSFWGKKSETTEIRNCNCVGNRSLLKEDELEFVKFHLIEVIGPFSSQ